MPVASTPVLTTKIASRHYIPWGAKLPWLRTTAHWMLESSSQHSWPVVTSFCHPEDLVSPLPSFHPEDLVPHPHPPVNGTVPSTPGHISLSNAGLKFGTAHGGFRVVKLLTITCKCPVRRPLGLWKTPGFLVWSGPQHPLSTLMTVS